MSDIYALWHTCYREDGQNYHDYLVWLAAHWLEYTTHENWSADRLCGRDALVERAKFALWIKRTSAQTLVAA
jgi:hypothetical protein